MLKIPIKKNQVWKNKKDDIYIEVFNVKGMAYRCRVLTDKPGVYNGTHTMTPYVLYKKFKLVSK